MPSLSHRIAWIRFTVRACVLQSERHVNKMVLWPGCGGRAEFSLHKKERAISVVRCKKEVLSSFHFSTWNILWFWNNHKRRRWWPEENNRGCNSEAYRRIQDKPNEDGHWKTLFIVKSYLRICCTTVLRESNKNP